MAQSITEEDGVHKQWYVDAKAVTPETLPAFMNRLANDYSHDYGTICHALAASAIAAAWAMNSTPQGGITGFQAGAVMWGFVQHWMSYEDQPLRLVTFENMLFPQYAERFDRTITPETWDWIKEQAAKRLADNAKAEPGLDAHPEVVAHWKSIISGTVPFDYRVVDQ